ncbi:hypothetical protein KIM372_09020 [Bombiscardovia nodaiensis]|uniref:Transport permease protein n=1 Tax=Bombiscardovia nodaiensis TaxID=2932181 RepID=A0ABM8B7Z5_9BIFI|nr:hypothetical protein KIM372_09020 [Bombiscardovia nodaiensis]
MKHTILPQFYLQTLSFLRNSKSVFFTLAFPVVLALLFGLAYKDEKLPLGGGGQASFRSWMILGLTAYVVLMGGFIKVAGDIASQRDSGLLKRIRLRGESDGAVLLGYALSGLVIALVCQAILLLAAVLFLGIKAPVNLPGTILVAVFGAVLCVVIGVAYSSFIPSADASQMMLLVPTLILMFLSGVFTPSWIIPSSLRTISQIFPVGYLADAMRSMWLGEDFVHTSMQTNGMTLGSHQGLSILVAPGLWVCVTWLVVSIFVALKLFRWDVRDGR